ncbi:MATE family efflux transporter [Clostridium sp.]|uniref:MATE family efflux transporter n=1 Tax=Clostridium sp. TaxID=1506 RepID=UPI0026055387|nr:MATE family efflux transporter [Clostridium sp.]
MIKDMTKGNPIKLMLLFSLPVLIGNIFQQIYSMVDTIIVGRYIGVEAFAAVGLTGSLNYLINGLIVGLTTGFAILVSQKFGAKKEDEIRQAIGSAVVLSILAAIIITVLSVLLSMPMLRIINTPENIIKDSNTYITIIFVGSGAVVAYNAITGILRALGDSRTPLYFLILSSFLNIFLDIVFIVNFKMGVSGAAYATIISQGFSAILCLIYAYKKYDILRLKKEDFKLGKRFYRKHLKIAVPMALQFSITAIGIIIIQGALNKFGSNAIASFTAASKALQLAMQPGITLGITIATYVGQNLGAENYLRIKEGVKKCANISIITSIIAGLVLIFGAEYFVKLFIENPDKEIIAKAKECLVYAGIFFIPLGLIFIYRNALQGMGESFIPMMAGVYELIARSVVAFTLPRFIGYTGICISDPIAWIAAIIPLMYTYHKKINDLVNVK